MAPSGQKMKNKNFTEKSDNLKRAKQLPAGVKKKRKWIPDHKTFKGSVQEGQGFALKKKQKIKHDYNKLLRKERKKSPEHRVMYKEEYPEHLKHLYLAEAEKMRSEAWANRVNRSKLRMKGQLKEMDEDEDKATTAAAVGGDSNDDDDDDDDDDTDFAGESKPTVSASGNPELTTASERESLPISNRMKKKIHKKTSNQKTKEEFERNREKQRLKKEEYLKNKQQREEAMQRYKQKKMETFQMLSKKTKKGQPNLNLQMEYLLQKIQGANK